MFSINNISIILDEKVIVNDVSFSCMPGTITVLMGPNGSGKSSLAYALMGHPRYMLTSGTIILENKNLIELTPDKRAQAGLFLAFQYPLDIGGVSIISFLKESYYALTGNMLSVEEFTHQVAQAFERVGLPSSYMHRSLHEGFSGGERKRLEVAQLLLLKPKVVILDEIDSGLDADGIRLCAQALLALKQECPSIIFIIITHAARLLQYIIPDQVHIIKESRLVRSGSSELVCIVENNGYREFGL